jgi:glucose-6-phosphate isomerase, archaeal
MRAKVREIFGTFDPAHPRVHWDGPVEEPELRMADDLKGIYARMGCFGSGPLYAMFRDLARTPADRWWLKEMGLRYDITVIPPRKICGEFVKTKGHYHPANPAGHGFPEIYEVLEGRAHYLLQREDMTDVVLVDAEAGDVVVVPPGYGHVTINPTMDQTLHMANIVSGRFASDYRKYIAMKGAAYYEMADGSFVKNRAYGRVLPLRRVNAGRVHTTKAGITFPLYHLIEQRKPVLAFLNTPEQFPELGALAYP